MSDPKPLPDHSRVVRALIDALMADKKPALSAASVKAPTPGVSSLPAAQAYVWDGSADLTEGDFVVDVAFFATTYSEASSLSRTFDARFMGAPHRIELTEGLAILDRVTTNVIPSEVPFTDDDSVRRFQATYSVSFRRR